MTEKDAPSKKRLFIGTFLPEPDQQRVGELAEFKDKLSQAWHRRLRWVRADKLHLTWVFLGYLEDERVEEVVAQLGHVLRDQKALSVTYAKPALWPSSKQPRTFVLVPDAVPEPIKDLADRIKDALIDYTQKPEKRGYRPHLTLGRLDPGHGAVQIPDWFPLADILPLEQPLDRIDVIHSHLGGSSDRYESLHSFELKR